MPKFTSDTGNVTQVDVQKDSIVLTFTDGQEIEVGRSWNELAPRFDEDMTPELRGEVRAALRDKPKRTVRKK